VDFENKKHLLIIYFWNMRKSNVLELIYHNVL